jgi:hypothetical protein
MRTRKKHKDRNQHISPFCFKELEPCLSFILLCVKQKINLIDYDKHCSGYGISKPLQNM